MEQPAVPFHVMDRAAQGRRMDVGASAVLPRVQMVQFAAFDGHCAARVGAPAVGGADRPALRLGEQALGSAQVKWQGLAVEDDRKDSGVAHGGAQFTGRERQPRGAHGIARCSAEHFLVVQNNADLRGGQASTAGACPVIGLMVLTGSMVFEQ
ncbi:hypothetical protein AAHB37_14310 [Glutamicibacter halophytocola]|uniref:hypothetical protein n=1 Tax=Glutamicibacter halophytocola TaxID=1933880 RepID=UPI00321BE61B